MGTVPFSETVLGRASNSIARPFASPWLRRPDDSSGRGQRLRPSNKMAGDCPNFAESSQQGTVGHAAA